MKALIVKKSWLSESDLRLDAPFHLSDGVKTKRLIDQFCPYQITTIKDESLELYKGNIHKRVYVTSSDHGYMFYSASDLFKSEPETGKYVSKKYSPYLKELELKKNWILITRSGTLGKCVLTTQYHEKKIGTDDLVRIFLKDGKIKTGYLFAFLSSRYGHGLLTQSGYGGVVKHIEPDHVEMIKVPVMPDLIQSKTNDLIIESTNLRVKANELLKYAETLIYRHLQISPQKIKALTQPYERQIKNSFSIEFSKISKWTLRSRNYSPRKQTIIDLLTNSKASNLRNVLATDPHYGARYKRIESFSVNSIELLSQGDLFDLVPKGRSISPRSIKNLDQEIALKETILVPAQGTLGENEIFGRAKFVWGYLEDKVIAGHAMRFIPDTKKIPSGYLFTVLNSSLWFRLFRNTVYGTNLLGFIVPILNELPIPRFEPAQELEIDLMVKDAHDKLTLANKKETEAIELIEKEIESWQKS